MVAYHHFGTAIVKPIFINNRLVLQKGYVAVVYPDIWEILWGGKNEVLRGQSETILHKMNPWFIPSFFWNSLNILWVTSGNAKSHLNK